MRPGIVKLMARRARGRGRTVIDSAFLTEIRNESMLLVATCLRGFGFEELSTDAFEVAKSKMRKLPRKVEVIEEIQRFLARRTEKNAMVLAKFQRYLEMIPEQGLPWTEKALSRIQRVPEALRPLVRHAIESAARAARERLVAGVTMLWTAEAEERLRQIPLAPIREMVVKRTEAWRGPGASW